MPENLLLVNARAILNSQGVSATYTPVGGDDTGIKVLLMSRRVLNGGDWNGEYADIYCHQEDVTPAIGDKFSVAGDTWLYRPQPGVSIESRVCGGYWVLPCSKSLRGTP